MIKIYRSEEISSFMSNMAVNHSSIHLQRYFMNTNIVYMGHNVSLPRARRGLRGIVFTLSVCLSVCVSVCLCVCPANILVFYFSAIRRDIDLICTQYTEKY